MAGDTSVKESISKAFIRIHYDKGNRVRIFRDGKANKRAREEKCQCYE